VLIAKLAYQRYIKLKPEKTLEYLDFLLKNDLLEDALSLYVKLISQSNELKLHKSEKEMLLELTEFISTYPMRAQHLECETII